ncbi:glutathione S-transferase, amine-terminal domain protein (macronuclear) [Tetrahymena thermophila SB210]|uniref:glutathione transferase n=1 Tax=Tetrahymena thermophila (strain SB210) TaxID=312017 RepID=I7M7X7_TETTS|nr:glutathione S-transferase, amine-terminal domain protein [Tetrahymena thermophila SB210]EAR96200.2 glutathione S-transferase, amine-terminal domain protein [Tetrahymena thermophila SB210]|eukprot:XP_001016445.2 glutathione S-transferase, amine-terminal domain protein [Tetrahymena thermophila SB210]
MIILGYWTHRGFAQPIRLLLEYLEVGYQEKLYAEGGDEWYNKDKRELKSNFPNLPYLLDGDNVITESKVIPIYLIKKFKRFDLLGQNEDGSFNLDEITVLQLIEVAKDLIDQLNTQARVPSFKEEKMKIFNEKFQITFEKFKKQLDGRDFLVGKFTYADLYFYNILKYFHFFYPEISIFTEYIQRIENIPQIKKYLQTKDNQVYLLERLKKLFYY